MIHFHIDIEVIQSRFECNLSQAWGVDCSRPRCYLLEDSFIQCRGVVIGTCPKTHDPENGRPGMDSSHHVVLDDSRSNHTRVWVNLCLSGLLWLYFWQVWISLSFKIGQCRWAASGWLSKEKSIPMYMYLYIYIYLCVCRKCLNIPFLRSVHVNVGSVLFGLMPLWLSLTRLAHVWCG